MTASLGAPSVYYRVDFMQGTMLLIVVWVIAITCLNYLGGWAEMFAKAEIADPESISDADL